MPCSLRLYFFTARYADMNTSAMITPIKAVETVNNTPLVIVRLQSISVSVAASSSYLTPVI